MEESCINCKYHRMMKFLDNNEKVLYCSVKEIIISKGNYKKFGNRCNWYEKVDS